MNGGSYIALVLFGAALLCHQFMACEREAQMTSPAGKDKTAHKVYVANAASRKAWPRNYTEKIGNKNPFRNKTISLE
jgi:hypothetical protein